MNELKTGFGNLKDNDLRTFGGSVHHALSTGDGLTLNGVGPRVFK